jgi:ribonucleotide monophosphatase NagD (HAD superfamily)
VAAYLKFMGFTQKVYVVGESGIQLELEEAGIRWIGGEVTLHLSFVVTVNVILLPSLCLYACYG